MDSEQKSFQPKDAEDGKRTPSTRRSLDTAQKASGNGRPDKATLSRVSQLLGGEPIFGFSSPQTDLPIASSSRPREIPLPSADPGHPTASFLSRLNTAWKDFYPSVGEMSLPIRDGKAPREPEQTGQPDSRRPRRQTSINSEVDEHTFHREEIISKTPLDRVMSDRIEAYRSLYNEIESFTNGQDRGNILTLLRENLDEITENYHSQKSNGGKLQIYRDFDYMTWAVKKNFHQIKEAREAPSTD